MLCINFVGNKTQDKDSIDYPLKYQRRAYGAQYCCFVKRENNLFSN